MVIMNQRRPFELIYPPIIKAHLKTIEPRHHSLISKSIEEQLTYQPEIETRNRKPLKRPIMFGAQWELRFGPKNMFRVFYKVNRDKSQVEILAIGVKKGNKLIIGGEEYRL